MDHLIPPAKSKQFLQLGAPPAAYPLCIAVRVGAEAPRNLGAIWGRNVTYPCEVLYLPQNANSSSAVDYLRHEYDRLLRVIQDVAGRTVDDNDLQRSIGIFNENRRLLRELNAAYETAPDPIEEARLEKVRRSQRRTVEGEW